MRAAYLVYGLPSAIWLALAASGTISTAETTSQDATSLHAPEDGGPRRWVIIGQTVQAFASPSTKTDVVQTLAQGAVLSNLGCTRPADEIWCLVRPFQGGARGYVPVTDLKPARGPDGLVAMGVDDSKRRVRQKDFDAKGEIPCAQEQGQAMGKCDAAVARSGGGDATVVVTFPNGFARNLYFIHGQFVRASATMSGVGTDSDWHLANDLHRIRVDDQRYELSNDFVLGK